MQSNGRGMGKEIAVCVCVCVNVFSTLPIGEVIWVGSHAWSSLSDGIVTIHERDMPLIELVSFDETHENRGEA